MTSDEFQSLMSEATYPVLLTTTGGRTYRVHTARDYWVPDTVRGVVFVALRRPERGVPCIHIDQIESLETQPNGQPSRYD